MAGTKLTVRAQIRTKFHRYPLLVLAGSAAIGILLDTSLQQHSMLGRTTHGISIWLSLFVLFCVSLWRLPSRYRWLMIALLLLPVMAIRHRILAANYRTASVLQIFTETSQPAVIDGRIDRPVVLRRHPLAEQMIRRDQSPWQTVVELHVLFARIGQQQQPFDGRALVVIDGKMDELLPGDQVRVFGWASRFTGPTNPGETDLRDIYRQEGLHIRVNVDSTQQVLREESDEDTSQLDPLTSLYRAIAKFSRRSRDILLTQMGETTGPLAVALVLGQRDFVDHQSRDELLVTGTAHLLSVSGLHLAIVAMMASSIATLFRANPTIKIVGILFVCITYTAITGGRPPVIRACMLVATWTFSQFIKRPSQPLNSLSLAALALLFINPELLFNIGVQLSFLAVTTLLMCGSREVGNIDKLAFTQAQRLDELVERSRSGWIRATRSVGAWIGQMFWFSGCVTAISTPLVWHQFHVVSPISVLTNVLLSPFLFGSLASGVATALLGCIHEPMAVVPGWICHWFIGAMRWVIQTAASVRWGHFWLPSPPGIWVTAFYLVLIVLLWFRPRVAGRKLRYGWMVIWMVIALFISTRHSPLPTDTLEVTFVDVGHGTCVVLRLGTDDVWLYDCGRLGNHTGSSRDIDATLWAMGVTRLSGIVLSHADSDHYNAMPGVLRRFGVQRIVTRPGMLDEQEPGLEETRQWIIKKGIPVEEMSAGEVIESASLRMSVLHPPLDRVQGSDNSNSLVVRIDHGGKSLILPGDLEPPGTMLLTQQDRPPPGGVLMAPHHGSLQLDAGMVLQWARPWVTIVSGGERAKRVEVRDMLSSAGSDVHVTASDGAIRIRISRTGRLSVQSWKNHAW